jgi:hypothetical protein
MRNQACKNDDNRRGSHPQLCLEGAPVALRRSGQAAVSTEAVCRYRKRAF